MKKEISMTTLGKWAKDGEEVHFIDTPNGKLVVFNPHRFVWNAYSKESIDTDGVLSDEQWCDFISESGVYLELPDDRFEDQLEHYVEQEMGLEKE